MSHDLPTCRHRGKIHGDRAFCRSTKAKKLPGGFVILDSCRTCIVVDLPHPVQSADVQSPKVELLPQAQSSDFPCHFRSDLPTGEKRADLCGMRAMMFPVYECSHPKLPNTCVVHRICRKQEETCCATCEKRNENLEIGTDAADT